MLVCANFIGHAPVAQSFEGAEDLTNFVMRPAVFLGVVESQLPLAGRCVFFSHSDTALLRLLHVTEVAGVAGFLGGSLKVGLADYSNFHVVFSPFCYFL